MKRQHRTYPLELRAGTKPDGSYFEGHCAVFNSIDCYGSIMAPGAFARTLPAFLERGFIGGLNHDWDHPIGRPKLAREDDKGLFVGADVLDTEHGMEVRKLLASGVCKMLSFGFEPTAKRYLERADDVKAYWAGNGYVPTEQDAERSKYGAVLYTDIDVYEASPVMLPGNDLAEITAVRGEPRAGVTLDEHLRTALAAVEGIADRVTQLAGLRARDGRAVAPERRALLRKMKDLVEGALAASEPMADPADVLKLRAELLQIEAGLAR